MVGQGSLRIDNIIETDAGLYTCRATNSEDSVDADASLTVHGKDTVIKQSTDRIISQHLTVLIA